MGAIEHDIQPGVGLGELRLGSSEKRVRDLLGEPTGVRHEDYGCGVNAHLWEHEFLGLSLSFDEDDDFRLGRTWSFLLGHR